MIHPRHADDPADRTAAPVLPEDAGSQALGEALRSSFLIVRVALALLVAAFLCSGFFTVGPQENAVILRFGKPVGDGAAALRGPGFHWAFPAPVDEIVRIPISQVQSASSTIGWYATTPEMEAAKTEPPPGPTLNPVVDGSILTGDANIIHVRAVLRYRIADPVAFTFHFTDAPALVTNALNNALLHAAAQYRVDDALTRDVTGFRDRIYRHLLRQVDVQRLGIVPEPPTVQAIPPRQLQEAFNRVLKTGMAADETVNKARSEENEILGRARSGAEARRNIAAAAKTRMIEAVAADAAKFAGLLAEYEKDPDLFLRLRQAETLEKVLSSAQEKFYLPARADGKPRELRIQLGREPLKPGIAPNQP